MISSGSYLGDPGITETRERQERALHEYSWTRSIATHMRSRAVDLLRADRTDIPYAAKRRETATGRDRPANINILIMMTMMMSTNNK